MSHALNFRIRLVAAHKVGVKITAKKRSRAGYAVIAPDGRQMTFPTRQQAQQNLLAQLRSAPRQLWTIKPL